MLYWIYATLLRRQIADLPAQICIMISGQDLADVPDSLYIVTTWCNEISAHVARASGSPSSGIQGLTFHIAAPVPGDITRYLPVIWKISTVARLHLHVGDRQEVAGTGMDVVVAIGKSGREEIAACIRKMARDGVSPEAVDENLIESYLTFKYTPDMVIKSGGDHLTDFLIWQSVYSELFFSDVNWSQFRKLDFLRVLRDYQARKRRFGK